MHGPIRSAFYTLGQARKSRFPWLLRWFFRPAQMSPHRRTRLSQISRRRLYQLAFFTPGMLPASACIRKLNCQVSALQHPVSVFCGIRLTLDILKSPRIPLPFPPRIHRFRIWVGRV
jgi:hypothetical protein